MLVSAERIRRQILGILHRWGMPEDLAGTTAEAMVETDLMGVDSHGISMLMDYDESRRRGQLNLKARPRVVRESPVTALLDADAGLGGARTVGLGAGGVGIGHSRENPVGGRAFTSCCGLGCYHAPYAMATSPLTWALCCPILKITFVP